MKYTEAKGRGAASPKARFDVASENAIRIITASLASGWLVTHDLHPRISNRSSGKGKTASRLVQGDNLTPHSARSLR